MNVAAAAKQAKQASRELAFLAGETRNEALKNIISELKKNFDKIQTANELDVMNAENSGLEPSLISRLKITEQKLNDAVEGIKTVINLKDPLNKILDRKIRAEGLILEKVSCPVGVIGIIFEARPEVIVQVCSLTIKSGNAVILKGGKEAENSNKAIFEIIVTALKKTEGFPENAVNMIFSREETGEILKLDEYIDLIIPRGSKNLVKFVKNNTKIPVLGHADGICHIYADEKADFEKALKIIKDAKCRYPSACNAVETVLINEKIKDKFVPLFLEMTRNEGITVNSEEIFGNEKFGTVESYRKEYGNKTLTMKFVKNVKEAVLHINTFGSGHTDAIITEDDDTAEYFMNTVDSAGVYKNASTGFADGFRYGLGAETGISTGKIHARGPVGVEGLTTYKYKLYGNGDIVSDFTSGKRKFFD